MRNKQVEGTRYLTMNTVNGSVKIVVAQSHKRAISMAKTFFGAKAPLYVIQDTLSTR